MVPKRVSFHSSLSHAPRSAPPRSALDRSSPSAFCHATPNCAFWTWNGPSPGNGLCYAKASDAPGHASDTMVSGGITPGPPVPPPPPVTPFSHPAGWHTAADIVRVRSLIASGKEPWRSAAQLLLNDTSLTAAYAPSPATLVCRTCCDTPCCAPGTSCPGAGSGGLERDGIASYYLMLRWIATSDTAWADAAERVLDAWSGKLTAFAGHDQMLAVGLYGGYLAQAAELLAYAKPSWPLKARAQRMFLEVIHPGCSLFCGRTNTGFPQPSQQTCAKCANGNWDAVCMSGVASWAVFLDNATMLESVHQYFKTGVGNGRLVNYIQNSQGQCQESGRDQGHTQLGIFNLVQVPFVYKCCWVAV